MHGGLDCTPALGADLALARHFTARRLSSRASAEFAARRECNRAHRVDLDG
jgi:hypothetical protein